MTDRRRSPAARRGVAARLSVAALVALGAGCARERPNLLVVTLDTTRADHLGAYGYAKAHTPAIDALASEGFVFRSHMTPVPITLPSHTTLMTGHRPPTHAVRDNGAFVVPAGEVTLAEVLRDAGYDTAAFVAAFPLASRFGLDQGFERYDDAFHRNPRDIFFDERPAGEVVNAAIAHHRARQPGRPFFTFLHFFDPHQPQLPQPPWDLRFREQPYDGEIAYVDSQLGRFFSFLKETGQWENTVVVVTADHGEGLGEHGELTHAILLHQATLHIPLIIAGPGLPRGETSEWTLSDQVFATLLEHLDVPRPALEVPAGSSLGPLIDNGGQRPEGWPRFTATFETVAPRTSQGWSQLAAYMKGDWRLVYGPRKTLHDLGSDPTESADRHQTEAAIAASLEGELVETLRRLDVHGVGAAIDEIDPETLARLVALGYLQNSPDSLRGMDDLLDVAGRIDPRDRVVDVALFSEAKAAMARRQWPLAASLWGEVLRRTPSNVAGHRALAMLAMQGGDLDQGLAHLDAGLAANPEALELTRLKGEVLIEVGREREGLDLLLSIDTSSLQACTWIGAGYQALGENQEAMAWFRKGLETEPANKFLRLYLANGLAVEGELAEAESIYRALIADQPYFSLAYYNYGKLLLDRGDTGAARPLLERAAQLEPGHDMTQRALRQLAGAGGTS